MLSELVGQVRCFKKELLKITQNSHAKTCARVSFLVKLQAWGPDATLLKMRMWQLFYCEFCENFKNTFFYRRTLVAASVFLLFRLYQIL